MIDPGLKNKAVLITGGNNPYGIGAATAKAFASQGALVFIHYFSQNFGLQKQIEKENDLKAPGLPFYLAQQKKSADEVVKFIRKNGGKVDSWECDLGKPDTIPALFDRAEKAFGPVDILINNAADYLADTFLPESLLKGSNAALWADGPLKSTLSVESHNLHFSVNTRAVALLMAEFVRRHIESNRHWGRIINISADCSWGCPGEISYRASKYALESYSRSAAAELGSYGITVNIVSPGPIQTGYISPEVEKALIPDIPMRRVGQPNDIADTILFFASEQARWITGQLLFVHGGHRMSLGQ